MGIIMYPGVGNVGITSYESQLSSAFELPDNYSDNIFPHTPVPQKVTRRTRYRKGIDATTTTGSTNGWNYAQTYARDGDTWTMDGQTKMITGSDIATRLNRVFGIEHRERGLNLKTKYYNRFKTAQPQAPFQKGFPHVFFVRPDCHLLKPNLTELYDDVAADPAFAYIWRESPELIKQLTINNGMTHHWMHLLSNHTSSFSLNDESIGTNTYGKTYTGYSISYGKHNIESKGSGTFSVDFSDDNNFSLYKTHKLWIDYISNMYRGQFSPDTNTILNKILDYAGAVYYVVTAADGETILFWSKYYGVFPTNIPSSQYSWASGNVLQSPSLSITFAYSFKEDFNPISLLEINMNSLGPTLSSARAYMPTYDPNLLGCGETWVGAPIVELDANGGEFRFKLRFLEPGS